MVNCQLMYHHVQDGAPKIAKLPYKWLYGRYNYSIHGAYFMVYKPTFTYLGGPILYGKHSKLGVSECFGFQQFHPG